MTNNDILRRIRFIENLQNKEMIDIFKRVNAKVDESKIIQWLNKDDHPNYLFMRDEEFANFLNGLIIKRRGNKEGKSPIAEKILNNNIILRKISIAYELRSENIIEILKLADFRVGKSELSAFFRKPEHKNYRECKSQILRNFLMGLQIKIRGV